MLRMTAGASSSVRRAAGLGVFPKRLPLRLYVASQRAFPVRRRSGRDAALRRQALGPFQMKAICLGAIQLGDCDDGSAAWRVPLKDSLIVETPVTGQER